MEIKKNSCKFTKEHKNSVIRLFLIISVYVVPAWVLFHAGWKEATTVCIFAIVTIILFRLEDIEALELWGLKAKLQKRIDEAAVTIEQLKKLAICISQPVYDGLAPLSLTQSVSLEDKYKQKRNIDAVLESIGIETKEIRLASQLWEAAFASKLAHLTIINGENLAPEIQKNAGALLELKVAKMIPPKELIEFLEKNALMSPAREKRLSEYLHFYETGEIKGSWKDGKLL